MDPELKSILRGLSLKLRHLLEGYYDEEERWHPGDLERRLNELGVWRDRVPKPIDELPHLSEEDLNARKVVDAYIQYRKEAGVPLEESVAEFVRESAYTWANRLFALRCMEARGLIDEVILQKEAYGWRSLQHNRLALKHPELCAGEDEGLFTVLFEEFGRRAEELPQVFNPGAPAIALRPSVATLKKCIALLSGRELVNGREFASDAVFEGPDAFGWAYQYWNEEEKSSVFEKVRTSKAKIEGANIIPVTCIYTEPYMVKFLVQNSLGATWMGMHPESRLVKKQEYYVVDADRAPVDKKPVNKITFLDPACGSGHFLLEAFEIFYDMYREEGTFSTSEEICASILNNNLFGIDIDERAVQISIAVLWMKAKEKAPMLETTALSDFHKHLLATNIRLPEGKDHLDNFLKKYPEDYPLRAALETIFEGLNHAYELGSLLQIEKPVEKELKYIRNRLGTQRTLFGPQTEDDWETWKQKVVSRLKEHFTTEAISVDFIQSFFSLSAGKGLLLFDLLSRRYDVVATNPPYMGSKNMGVTLKNYIQRYYAPGKRDLFAAFILRCLELVQLGGRVAMVTQQSWMFLRSYSNLRATELNNKKLYDDSGFKGLLRETVLETVVHIGTGGFSEISGAVVNSVLFVLRNKMNEHDHQITFFDLTKFSDVDIKDHSLKLLCCGMQTESKFVISSLKILKLPGSPFLYWTPPEVMEMLASPNRVGNYVHIPVGIQSFNDNRLVRAFWEVPPTEKKWRPYAKGGPYKKWVGLEHWVIRYGDDGKQLIPFLPGSLANVKFFDSYGTVYTDFAQGNMSVREKPKSLLIGNPSPGIFPTSTDLDARIGLVLNARFYSLVLRMLSPSPLHFRTGYVAVCPGEPLKSLTENRWLLSFLVSIKESIISKDPTEARFQIHQYKATSLLGLLDKYVDQLHRTYCFLHTAEFILDLYVEQKLSFQKETCSHLYSEVGYPSGYFPLIAGLDSVPELFENLKKPPVDFLNSLRNHDRIVLNPKELESLKQRMRRLYEAGPGKKSKKDERDKNLIPAETFLEEISQIMKIHPISVYWLLKDGIAQEGWRCHLEDRRVTTDIFSILILRLLGYLWPKQIESGEPAPDWADPDGIIPLTKGTGESTLLDRLRNRITKEGRDVTAIEHEFAEIIGKSLDQWLTTEFFKQHTKQFKRRPIAWQVESRPIGSSKRGRGRRRTSRARGPAFSCIVYYHNLDHDFLPKIRSQYVGPLRTRYETELRTLENLEIPTADQTERRTILGNLIEELKGFDAKLEEVTNNGFDNPLLRKIVVEEPLDEWTSIDGEAPPPSTRDQFYVQEKAYNPDINDGVRVNIAPLQKAGLLAADVLSKKDVDRAIRDRAEWRADERRLCREGKLPQPGWWKTKGENT